MAAYLLAHWLADVQCSPDVLRRYASIFEMVRRHSPDGPLMKPSDVSLTAAKCFRIVADLKELQAVAIGSVPTEKMALVLAGEMETHSVNEFIDAKYIHK